jgi:hypothetical protein
MKEYKNSNYASESMMWFFLGVGLTIVIFLIMFTVPVLKGLADIAKDGIGALATIIAAISAVVMIRRQMVQQIDV